MLPVRLLAQTVLLALAQMWANKVRAALAMLMIVIGVAALIVIVGGSEGFKRNILKEFESVGANKVWVFPRFPHEARNRFSWRQVRLNVSEADGMLARCPSLDRLTPILDFSVPLQFHEQRKPFVHVQGIRPVWHEIEQRFVTVGRPFSSIDLESVRNVCLVNDKAVEEMNLPGGGPGNYILVGDRRFLIVGVVETKAVAPMFHPDDAQSEVYIPFNTAQVMKPDNGIYVVAQTKKPELFEDAKAEVSFYLRNERHLKPTDPNTFGVEAIEQYIAQVRRMGTIMTIFLSALVMIALVVGGVGIMVIQFVSVKERTREIGLRKAVGAKPQVVLLQFLVESIVLCVVGAAIGLGIGYPAIAAIRLSTKAFSEAYVPVWAAALAVLFCSGVGVVFGLIPAIAAARLDPIDALRHE
ncbi:MAG TPA: ABC transporter permease [Phycisphaerales bacterium]|jgi:putative ABC transport system permease protein|nr:ABC transporter permease [Phycisphaerales bacterium]